MHETKLEQDWPPPWPPPAPPGMRNENAVDRYAGRSDDSFGLDEWSTSPDVERIADQEIEAAYQQGVQLWGAKNFLRGVLARLEGPDVPQERRL